jgi:hypothetical protein
MFAVLVGALLVAAIATAGSMFSPHVPAQYRAVYQLGFYFAWFLTIGGVIGAASGKTLRGLAAGFVAGLAAFGLLGGTAYVIRHVIGLPAEAGTRRAISIVLFAVIWIVIWCVLSLFNARVLRANKGSWGAAIVRGTIAAILSGAAVILITMDRPGDLRTNPTRRFLFTFVGWTLAIGPGLAAVVGERTPAAASNLRREDVKT